MQTPNGVWRVEVVKRDRTRWYRVVHGDNALYWLSIAAVQRARSEAGVIWLISCRPPSNRQGMWTTPNMESCKSVR